MGGSVERLIEEEREQLRREEERAKRIDAAYAVVMALPQDERRRVLVRLIEAVEAGAKPTKKTAAKKATEKKPTEKKSAEPTTSGKTREPYTVLAERFVLGHTDGVRTREVAEAIGQDTSAVDGTLRLLMKRGMIERRGRFWVPKGGTTGKAPPPPKPRRKTIRDYIVEVYGNQNGGPLTAAAIYRGAKQIKPDISKSSVDGEINRMRYVAKPALLVQVGTGENNGGIYALANGGAHAAAAN